MGIIKELIVGGLKGIGDSAKDIIAQVAENKITTAEASIILDKEINRHEEEISKAHLADVASARETNVSIQESDKSSWMAKNIAYIIDVFIALIWGLFTLYLAAISARLLETRADMTGLLSIYSTITAVFMITVNFHRGTSRGSQEKQSMLNKLYPKN
jgi:hypothetical protein